MPEYKKYDGYDRLDLEAIGDGPPPHPTMSGKVLAFIGGALAMLGAIILWDALL